MPKAKPRAVKTMIHLGDTLAPRGALLLFIFQLFMFMVFFFGKVYVYGRRDKHTLRGLLYNCNLTFAVYLFSGGWLLVFVDVFERNK